MKVSAMLFSLLVACQVLPVTMHSAASQNAGTMKAAVDAANPVSIADRFYVERMRVDYKFAVDRLQLLAGKQLAYTYDFFMDTNMTLAGGNEMKTQSKTSYAYDKDGRSRTIISTSGVERIIIADPTRQTVYLVCPERKEILRLASAALVSSLGEAPSWQVPDADKSGTRTGLGEKTIAGVTATGSRAEQTIPAGVQGNDKPLVHTLETWYAADLATAVYSHASMPEFGDIVMHVENLQFGDVPASTFALPDGYAIHDIALAGHEAK